MVLCSRKVIECSCSASCCILWCHFLWLLVMIAVATIAEQFACMCAFDYLSFECNKVQHNKIGTKWN